MSKMTDENIKKALECCGKNVLYENCVDCPYEKDFGKDHICTIKVAKDALDLINRQQAEIDRLKKGWKADVIETENIKAEAIKEYKEKLREHAYLDSGITGFQEMVVDLSDIENIADEMVGEGK